MPNLANCSNVSRAGFPQPRTQEHGNSQRRALQRHRGLHDQREARVPPKLRRRCSREHSDSRFLPGQIFSQDPAMALNAFKGMKLENQFQSAALRQ